MGWIHRIAPWKINGWNPKMEVWKMIFPFKCFFWTFHVNSMLIFRGVIKHVVCMQRRSLLFLTHSDRETGLRGCDCFWKSRKRKTWAKNLWLRNMLCSYFFLPLVVSIQDSLLLSYKGTVSCLMFGCWKQHLTDTDGRNLAPTGHSYNPIRKL